MSTPHYTSLLFVELSVSTVHAYLKKGFMKRHTSAIKPTLTPANKYARLKFAASFVDETYHFKSMYEYVHLDEKWFYMSYPAEKYYLAPNELPPERHCQSK